MTDDEIAEVRRAINFRIFALQTVLEYEKDDKILKTASESLERLRNAMLSFDMTAVNR